ncbi:MAG: YcnI family protein [Alphaproteobacteria bacterium]|nr:YcnI family protein [Alphaproteobacteria bacterium]
MKRILALMLVAALPAAAHVTIDPPEAPANSFARIALRVPHGCAGNATTAIEVTLPEGVTMARPQPRPGWQIAVEMRALARPQASEHGLVRQSPAAIAWRGGPLPDAHYEEFVMMIRTPDRPGETLLFPVAQLCENDTRHDWVEPPGATPRPRQPAATLRLAPR